MDDDCQKAIITLRGDLVQIEKRIIAQEIHADHYKEAMQNLRSDFMNMQGSIKIDIERVQTSLHKDIKLIHDILSDLIKKQAVEEAKISTGVNTIKFLSNKLPWIVAIGASFTAMIQFVKDNAS